ncbi:hypothetical protein FN846DRAFT_965753 [Sphaerosporella brunnea]|uniref:Uncharacterized protein n=1 Tax=Sphaerosporella brunnea TaxID=1250544 RepID=A0A5J5EM43_9PEZI|nr:hypothetical protein FN846DRAFT_965753 [Sphaerosporella brunnea]
MSLLETQIRWPETAKTWEPTTGCCSRRSSRCPRHTRPHNAGLPPQLPPNGPAPPGSHQPPAPIEIRVLLFRRGANRPTAYAGEFRFVVHAGLTWMDLARPCGELYGIPPNQLAGVVWQFDHRLVGDANERFNLRCEVAAGGNNCGELERLLWRFATCAPALQSIGIRKWGKSFFFSTLGQGRRPVVQGSLRVGFCIDHCSVLRH